MTMLRHSAHLAPAYSSNKKDSREVYQNMEPKCTVNGTHFLLSFQNCMADDIYH